jgi:hypothetical protein
MRSAVLVLHTGGPWAGCVLVSLCCSVWCTRCSVVAFLSVYYAHTPSAACSVGSSLV